MSAKVTETGLKARQQRFVDEYLVDLNATQAAIRAGYSAKTARAIGAENLTKPDIVRAVTAAIEARAKKTGVTAERVLRELARVGFSNVDHYRVADGRFTLADGAPKSAMRAVASVKHKVRVVAGQGEGEPEIVDHEVEYRLWNKVEALKKLGEHVGLFANDDGKQPTAPVEVRVVFRHEGRRVNAA